MKVTQIKRQVPEGTGVKCPVASSRHLHDFIHSATVRTSACRIDTSACLRAGEVLTVFEVAMRRILQTGSV